MSKRICSVVDCKTQIGRHGAKGYCPKHYKRYKAHGSPHITLRPPRNASLLEAIKFHGWDVLDSGCWIYRGTIGADGYGTVASGSSRIRVHRAMYEHAHRSISPGMVVRHTCDNPPCINPDHLLQGTPKQNSADAVERQRMANGERHGMHKIDDSDVEEMRNLYDRGLFTQRQLAKKFGCSQAQVNNILLRKQRKDLTYRPIS